MGGFHARAGRLALVMIGLATQALGQESRVELSAVVSAGPVSESLGFGARVGAFLSGRSAFEVTAEWTDLGRRRLYADQIVWVYSLQGRSTVHGSHTRASSVFVTYGATGWAERTTRPQEGLTTLLLPPLLPTGGVGWQYARRPGTSMRAEVQAVFPIGELLAPAPRLLVAAGFAVP